MRHSSRHLLKKPTHRLPYPFCYSAYLSSPVGECTGENIFLALHQDTPNERSPANIAYLPRVDCLLDSRLGLCFQGIGSQVSQRMFLDGNLCSLKYG
jgi:hypothetical protein